MSKIAVIYWSGTGNTAIMANEIAAGIGTDAEVFSVDAFHGNVADYDKIAFGCSAMGDEVLEEAEFEPFFTAVEGLSLIHISLRYPFPSADAAANVLFPVPCLPLLLPYDTTACQQKAKAAFLSKKKNGFCSNTVSYTHLDVYKRQVRMCSGQPLCIQVC